MTNPIQSLASAELAIVLKPVDEFLTALQEPNVNIATIVQDFAKLQLAVIQDLPELEAVGIGGIAAALQKKLHNFVSSVDPVVPATPAVVEPTETPETVESVVKE